MVYTSRKKPSRKKPSRKKPSRKKPSRKTTRKTRRYKGGGTSSATTTGPVPVQSYPLQPGASSQRESAMLSGQNRNAKQQSLLNSHGGGRRRKLYYGGSCAVPSEPVTVPTFSNSGSKASPVNANSSSALSNSTAMQSSANACNDCHATGTCKD